LSNSFALLNMNKGGPGARRPKPGPKGERVLILANLVLDLAQCSRDEGTEMLMLRVRYLFVCIYFSGLRGVSEGCYM